MPGRSAVSAADDDVRSLALRLGLVEARQQAQDATIARLIGAVFTPSQKTFLRALLPVLGGCYGSSPFTTREIFESEAPGLVLTRRGSRQALGRWLALAQDVPVGDFIVRDAGVEHGARRWTIERVVRRG